jgi:hypothetical protein
MRTATFRTYIAALLIALLPGIAGEAFAAAPRDSVALDSLVGDKLYYLELKGTIRYLKGENKDEAEILDSAIVKVYNERNVLVAEHITNRKGRCNFKLPLNRRFVVEVSKPGFVTKKIEVNTKVPPERKLAYIFPFSIDIFEEVPGLDVSALNKPIARISYLFTITQFDYDNVYTSKVNQELKKMYREYYQLQKIAADTLNNPVEEKKPVAPDTSKKKKP